MMNEIDGTTCMQIFLVKDLWIYINAKNQTEIIRYKQLVKFRSNLGQNQMHGWKVVVHKTHVHG